MEQKIYDTDDDFDFTKISISQPSAIQGGAYITKIKYAEDPLYIQTPKCLTKQGINTTNKKAYADLMYSNEYNNVVEWFENLESVLVKLIYEKRELWFQNEMDLEDIENFFSPITRAYKGGKYHLVRINIPKNKTLNSQYSCSVYDENENMIPIQDLTDSHNIIPCLEVQSIKFSARNFQVELVGKQIMILNNKPLFTSCMIKRPQSINKQSISDMIHDIDDQKIECNLENEEIPTYESLEEIDTNEKLQEQQQQEVQEQQLKLEQEQQLKQEQEQELKLELEQEQEQQLKLEQEQQLKLEQEQQLKLEQPLQQTKRVQQDNENHLEDIVENNNGCLQNETDSISLNEVSLEDITNDIDVNINNTRTSITLNNPNEVYREIYKIARQKAREHKKAAITHYLEAKKIKNTYMLDDLYQVDDSSSDEEIDSDSDDIKNKIDEIVEELT